MQTWYFSENAYPYLPDEATYESIRVTLPNGVIDPKTMADLYHRYLDEWLLAEEHGLNIMVNEHHQTATNLNPSAAVVLGALSRITKRARILILGNPIANRRDPVRVAEEMAMVDNYSRGRLEVGFVRGVPYEISAVNSNPVHMADRMWEAHDLIKKAWTTHDGPFNWEGRYFNYRQVNVWPRPYQEPHPPIWFTGLSSTQMPKIAEHGYVAATFLTGFAQTKAIFDTYRAQRAALGLPMSLDRLAYAALVYVGKTDQEGFDGARKLMWYFQANKVPTQFSNPPGYSSVKASVGFMRGGETHFDKKSSLEACIEAGMMFAGNPDTVCRQIAKHYDAVGGYGHLLAMGQAGFLEHAQTAAGIAMLGDEVAPRLRAVGSPVAVQV
jgi:alkanesulfonate monooxygenase SsuD/methylene tetrahydromethanopterin reductase-like flavin-dependent oxidoreductase (luciferase family)